MCTVQKSLSTVHYEDVLLYLLLDTCVASTIRRVSGQCVSVTDSGICYKEEAECHFPPRGHPFVQHLLLKSSSFPQCSAVTVQKSRDCVCVGLFLSYSVPLATDSVPAPGPRRRNHYSFVVSLSIRQRKVLTLLPVRLGCSQPSAVCVFLHHSFGIYWGLH